MFEIYSNFNLPPQTKEFNSGIQITIPDLAYSIPEILDMAIRGEYDIPFYQEDVTSGKVYNLRASDLTDLYPEVGTNLTDEQIQERIEQENTNNPIPIKEDSSNEQEQTSVSS